MLIRRDTPLKGEGESRLLRLGRRGPERLTHLASRRDRSAYTGFSGRWSPARSRTSPRRSESRESRAGREGDRGSWALGAPAGVYTTPGPGLHRLRRGCTLDPASGRRSAATHPPNPRPQQEQPHPWGDDWKALHRRFAMLLAPGTSRSDRAIGKRRGAATRRGARDPAPDQAEPGCAPQWI